MKLEIRNFQLSIPESFPFTARCNNWNITEVIKIVITNPIIGAVISGCCMIALVNNGISDKTSKNKILNKTADVEMNVT